VERDLRKAESFLSMHDGWLQCSAGDSVFNHSRRLSQIIRRNKFVTKDTDQSQSAKPKLLKWVTKQKHCAISVCADRETMQIANRNRL
jgi:hypothetical protein